MIVPGASLLTRRIVQNLQYPALQSQPCGIDLTLRHVLEWTSPGTIDFSNQHRRTAQTSPIPFTETKLPNGETYMAIHLKQNSYLVEFNETVEMPLDEMGQVFVRSTLFRSGALVSAGVMDSGYHGAMGALLTVLNPHGIVLHQGARLAQFVNHKMSEPVKGYSGVYQGKAKM
ncbi:putative dUTP diphosphatase Dut [Tirmania nivea]|nr:putative dUTP diphosphatase Dut [Tirmania nivea]